MQSQFLLKSIFCILIINVTLCRSSISTAFCNARCYWSHNGFDYGYYENGQCKCAPPTVYVFDGMGRDFSDEYIEKSLNSKNLVENPVTRYQNGYGEKSSPSTTVNVDDSNMKTWKLIVETITKKYSFIEETDLEKLKSSIADDERTMKYVLLYLRRPLENALEDIKKLKPSAADGCDELSRLLLQRRPNNKLDEENSEKSIAPKSKIAAAAVRAKSIDVNAKPKGPKVDCDVSKKNEKPIEKERKIESKTVPEPAAAAVATKEKNPQKILVEVESEEYVDDDGGVKKKAKERDARKAAAVKKHAATGADEKEHEVNGSGSGSGSWTYEEYN